MMPKLRQTLRLIAILIKEEDSVFQDEVEEGEGEETRARARELFNELGEIFIKLL